MEKFKHKNGTGSLFANDKRTNEKQPVMKGTMVAPDGTEYRISAWERDGKSGKFFSLAIEPSNQDYKPATEKGLPF
jgi:hypothetical protein